MKISIHYDWFYVTTDISRAVTNLRNATIIQSSIQIFKSHYSSFGASGVVTNYLHSAPVVYAPTVSHFHSRFH